MSDTIVADGVSIYSYGEYSGIGLQDASSAVKKGEPSFAIATDAPAAPYTVPKNDTVAFAGVGVGTITIISSGANQIYSNRPFVYDGVATEITAAADGANITAERNETRVNLSGDTETVHLNAAYQSLYADNGGSANITSLLPSLIVLGSTVDTPAVQKAGPNVVHVDGEATTVRLLDPDASSVIVLDGPGAVVDQAGGVATIYATVGGALYDGTNGSSNSGDGSLVFVQGDATQSAVSTIMGSNGNTTIFATTGVDATLGGGGNTFVGGSGASTVMSSGAPEGGMITGHDTVFGGQGPLLVGLDANLVFVGGGGSATLTGGMRGSVPVTVFSGQGTTQLKSLQPDAVVVGSGGKVDGSLAGQGTTYYGMAGFGDETLNGSLSAPAPGSDHDIFTAALPAPGLDRETLTFGNFQQGDSFFLLGATAQDVGTFQQAVAMVPSGYQGRLTFALDDGTVVNFINGHPAAVTADGGGY